MAVLVEPPHGTRRRYVHRTFACRCPRCRRANTRYMRAYRRRLATIGVAQRLPLEAVG